MDTEITVDVVRQVQSTKFYCGAACAVMVLSALNRKLTQDAAYELIRSKNAEADSFYPVPQGLAQCLDSVVQKANKLFDFEADVTSQPEDILTAVFHALSDMPLPVPVLVKGGAHWVIVSGVTAENEDSGTALKLVTIVDPWPGSLDRTIIPADVFQEQYLPGISFGTRWRDRRVAIARQGVARRSPVTATRQLELGGGGKPDVAD